MISGLQQPIYIYTYLRLQQPIKWLTHKLARHAICVSDFAVWMENVPPLLFPIVLADIDGFT